MRFEFIADEHVKVKTFLKKHEVSKGLLAKIKFRGGDIRVNGHPQNATYLLDIGDVVVIDIPPEEGFETLEAIDYPLDILFEDDHFLILNKPFGVASIPSVNHSNTIANFIKGYYVKQNYENQQVHIVTRLDRDTSGLMLFAKHGYAHARLDKQLQKKAIEKRYFALVKGDHLVDIRLHTGRTHQIRVHFSHIGFPLLGDDLYGGSLEYGIERQALHCHYLSFYHPFLEERLEMESPLPDDFNTLITQLSNNNLS